MTQKPKIIFAVKNMETAKGGAEKVLATIINGLHDKGHNVHLLSFDPQGAGTIYDINSNIPRLQLGIGNAKNHATKDETIDRIKALREIIKQEQPDIIIGFMHSMFIPLSLAMIGLKIPLIASEHIVPRHYRGKWLEFILLLIAGILSRKMTVVLPSVKKLYPLFLHHKIIVMPNPVSIKVNETKTQTKENIILNVGRLSHQKDQKSLIRAFAKIAKNYKNWSIRIVGDGDHKTFLQSLIDDLDLQDQVYLPGTTDQIEKEYNRASIFVMPSKYESFGLATVEAMAHGLPAIGFDDCPGTNDLIKQNENGLLVSGKNRIDNLAAGLQTLMEDQNLRKKMGENGKHIIDDYQEDKVISLWEKLIKDQTKI